MPGFISIKMQQRYSMKNLLKIKSIVTILLTLTFIGMIFLEKEIPDLFVASYGAVIAFLYAKKDSASEQK